MSQFDLDAIMRDIVRGILNESLDSEYDIPHDRISQANSHHLQTHFYLLKNNH